MTHQNYKEELDKRIMEVARDQSEDKTMLIHDLMVWIAVNEPKLERA